MFSLTDFIKQSIFISTLSACCCHDTEIDNKIVLEGFLFIVRNPNVFFIIFLSQEWSQVIWQILTVTNLPLFILNLIFTLLLSRFNLALLEKFYYKESQIKIQAVCESIALDKMNKKYTTDQQPAARQVTRLEQKRLITLKIIFHQGVGQVPFKFKIL